MKKIVESLLANGIIIALVTFAGYLLADAYEAAYVQYFGISRAFVSVDINSIVAFAASFLVLFTILIWLIIAILSFMPFQKNSYFETAILMTISYLVIASIALIYQLLFGWSGTVFIGIFSSIAAIWVWTLLTPFVTQRKIKGIKNKFSEAQMQMQIKKDKKKPPMETYASKLPSSFVLFVLFISILAITIFAVRNIGENLAKKQNIFSASEKYNDFLLISANSDIVILTEYKDNEFTKRYIVLSPSELGYMKQVKIER